jgi:serine/threonine-protein kinase
MLRRTVAVKVLSPQLAADASFVQRFRREAVAAANLRHPNIVTIYDVGEDTQAGQTVYYLVMEYIEGETLDRLLQQQRQPFSLRDTDAIIHQVADALEYAHARGMIHRDVKPANIMLGRDGRVTLMDFGLVRAGELSQLTQTGSVLGTPLYMAPEQVMGAEVDRRTDIYALGVVIYELLAGEVPFMRTTPLAIAHAHVYDPPPPLRQKRPDLPPSVETVVLRALAKNPGGRYQDASQLAADFTRATTGQMPIGPAIPDSAPPGATIRAAPPQRTPPQSQRPVTPPPAAPTPPRAAAYPPPASRKRPSPALWAVLVLALLALGAGALAALGVFRSGSPATGEPTPLVESALTAAPAVIVADTTPTAALAPSPEQGSGASSTETPTASTPSATSTVEPATSTPIPASPTPTAAQAAQAQVIGDVLNVRSGPDTAYELLGQARLGETYGIVGRNASGSWLQLCCVDGEAGWVASNLVRASGPVDLVAVVEVPAPTASPTLEPTATAIPTSVPTPTPTSAPCSIAPGPTFARVWRREQMGCAITDETGVTSAYETFERGFMLWRSDNDGHYAVYGDGTFDRFVFPSAEPPEFACVEAAQLGRPQRGFSKVWCENPSVRERLGNAVVDEVGNDRPIQTFEQGFMVFIPERGQIYALRNGGAWEKLD